MGKEIDDKYAGMSFDEIIKAVREEVRVEKLKQKARDAEYAEFFGAVCNHLRSVSEVRQ